MSFHDSYSMDEYDPDNDDYDDPDDYQDREDATRVDARVSDEDTEEASETDMGNHEEPRELREEVYQDKLENFNLQLRQLREHSHPKYIRRLQELEQQYAERVQLNKLYYEYSMEWIEQDYIIEQRAAAKEFEEKKVELKENLIADFEDKKKHIENERHNMELNGDSMEVKPVMTRKLRRRPNDPPPVPDKRRKPLTTNLVFLLDEKDIDCDLRQISRARPPMNAPRKHHTSNSPIPHIVDTGSNTSESRVPSPHPDVRVEDGKLSYDKRWYHRGQSIFVEERGYPRFPAHITAIGHDCIWVKKATPDGNSKVRIYISLLAKGKVTIRRRAP